MANDEAVIKAACIQAAAKVVATQITQQKDVGNAGLAAARVAWEMWRNWDTWDKGVTQPPNDPTPQGRT